MTRTGSRTLQFCIAGAALLLGGATLAADDVEFYANLDSPQVALGDTVALRIVLSGSKGTEAPVELPVMPDIDVVSRQHSSSTQINLGGAGSQITHQNVYTFLLSPKRVGTLTIPPATARVGGAEIRTSQLTLKVAPADQAAPRRQARPQQAPDPFQGLLGGNPFAGMPGADEDPFQQMFGQSPPPADSDLFVRTTVDKKSAYLGEQITLSIYLFSRVDVSGVENIKLPKLDAFWAEDIESPNQISGELKTINGIPYRVYLLKRRALFPLKAGKQTVDPVEVDVSTGMSIFGAGHRSHRASQGVDVNIQPLPAGEPAGFEATNVGQWRISASTNPSPAKTAIGQPVTLVVNIEGTGNIKDLAVPKLPPTKGLRAFDPTTTDKVVTSHGRYGGKRSLEYLLMPEQTGTFQIPPIELVTFNPATGTYVTNHTDAIPVEVAAGSGAVSSSMPSTPSNAGGNLLTAGLSKPIHIRGELLGAGQPIYDQHWYSLALLFPWLVLFSTLVVGAIARNQGKHDPTAQIKRAHSRARRQFKGAIDSLEVGNAATYYSLVAKGLQDYLSAKMGVSTLGLTRDDLTRALRMAGAGDEPIRRVAGILESCDLGRFAPGTTQARNQVLDEATQLVDDLEHLKLKHLEGKEFRPS